MLVVDFDVMLLWEIEVFVFELFEMDFVVDELLSGVFDFVYIWFVLLYILVCEVVLCWLVVVLWFGGVLLFEEDDIYFVFVIVWGVYCGVWEVFLWLMVVVGIDFEWVCDLLEWFGGFGFDDVGVGIDG